MARQQNLAFTTLGNIVESISYHIEGRENKIELAREQIFTFPYSAFSVDWKKDFERQFLRQFYFTEIGFETEGRFFFELESWLQLNMEYYTKLIGSQIFENMIDNPLSNYDLTETFEQKRDLDTHQNSSATDTRSGTSNGTQSQTGSGSEFSRELIENTPDGRLQITANDGTGVIEYASSIDENKTTSNNSSSLSSNETNNQNSTLTGKTTGDELEETEHTLTRKGNIGIMTYDQLLNGYRTIFKQYEKEIFEKMRQELFMLVY